MSFNSKTQLTKNEYQFKQCSPLIHNPPPFTEYSRGSLFSGWNLFFHRPALEALFIRGQHYYSQTRIESAGIILSGSLARLSTRTRIYIYMCVCVYICKQRSYFGTTKVHQQTNKLLCLEKTTKKRKLRIEQNQQDNIYIYIYAYKQTINNPSMKNK